MKKVLILGGSSDIGIEVVKKFLNLNWFVHAHYNRSNKRLINLKNNKKNLKVIQLDFSKYNNKNFEKKINKENCQLNGEKL